MAQNTLTVRRCDPQTLKWHEMASFTLKDGKVKATFHDVRYRHEVLNDGVRVGPKVYKPKDGPRFMAALERAYMQSSLLEVQRS